MMDLSSDVGGPGLPLLDYKTYAERVFFPGQQTLPLSRQLDLPESRRQTVEQGLQQLNNLLNNRLFLTRVGDANVTCLRSGDTWGLRSALIQCLILVFWYLKAGSLLIRIDAARLTCFYT